MRKGKYEKLRGLSAIKIAKQAACSKHSVYNWAKGGGTWVGPSIEAAIQKLLLLSDQKKTGKNEN